MGHGLPPLLHHRGAQAMVVVALDIGLSGPHVIAARWKT